MTRLLSLDINNAKKAFIAHKTDYLTIKLMRYFFQAKKMMMLAFRSQKNFLQMQEMRTQP